MKTRLSIIAVIGLLTLMVNHAKAQFSFGVFVDPQLSWFNSDTKKYDPNGSVASFNVGFTADKYFAQRYALSSGLSLNSLGGNLKFAEPFALKTNDSTYTVAVGKSIKLKAQYITLPVGFKFRTNQIGYNTFFANVGLKANFRIKGFAWDDSNGVDRETATDHFKFAFVAYYIGVGMERSLGDESALQFGLSFTSGLSKILDTENGSIMSQSLSLRVGIVF
ncbi:MAG: outer membrane beta-barrel protein [Bacteroidales bacterium]|nr:outer membrane beta-barrel protein [Bacteroidales bacterium]